MRYPELIAPAQEQLVTEAFAGYNHRSYKKPPSGRRTRSRRQKKTAGPEARRRSIRFLRMTAESRRRMRSRQSIRIPYMGF